MAVLLTKPKDLDYELFIFKRYEGLMTYLLLKKEARSGATLEEDLHTLRNKKCEEVGYTTWMAIVYRCEKKKILASQIDMCHYIIRILQELLQRKD